MANKRSPKKTARTKAVLRFPDLDQAKSAVFEKPEFARRSTQIGGPRICLIGMRSLEVLGRRADDGLPFRY